MTIPSLSALPVRGAAGFSAAFEALLVSLQTGVIPGINAAVTEVNAAAAAAGSAVAGSMNATSTTSVTIATGNASLAVQTGKLFAAGQYVMVISTANPAVWLYGTVSSYNGTTGALVVSVTDVSGSGSLASWTISPAGLKGAPGGVTLTGVESLTNKTMGAGSLWQGGTIAVTYGGTGATSLTGVIKGNGTGAMAAATAGTDYTTPAGTESLTYKTMGTGCVWNGGAVPVTYGGTGAATLTGIVKGNGTGAMTAATAGTDYLVPGGALGTPSSGNLSGCTVDGTNAVGYKNVPQNSQSAAYTLVLADAGKHILHPAADTTVRTFTIPANGSVAYPVGTAITLVNQNAAGTVTIAITTDTMRLAGAGTTGSRTLAANGVATALKITSTEWIVSGSGLS